MRLVASVFAMSLACAGAAQAQGKFWENGDFAIPKPKAGGFSIVDTGERFGVWRVIGAPGSVSWTSGTYAHNGYSFPAQGDTPELQAEPWVNLAAISQSATGIMHAPVPTTVGQSYTLTFYVGNVVNPRGIYGTSSTVNVYENATLIGTAVNSDGAGSTTQNWKLFTYKFKADYAYTTISFINGDPPGDMDCGISNTLLAPAGLNPVAKQEQ